MRICDPFPNLSEDELLAIVTADWSRNYQTSGHTREELLKALQEWRADGLPIGYHKGVIFIARQVAPGEVEFHSMNGASLRVLLEGTRRMLRDFREQGVRVAGTYFSNFRVSDLAKFLGFPYVTDFSPLRPEERKFCTTFLLGN